jgi:hypothetical protein
VGLAVPVAVGGRIVAVLYADDVSPQDRPVPAAWPEVIEILARHAARALEVLTARRTSQLLSGSLPGPVATGAASAPARATPPGAVDGEDGARRYARLLVSEVKLYNEAAVKLGREQRDLLDRLAPEIDRARKLYEERVSSNVRARNLYFDQELVRTLADGDPSLLGS